jgi:hypothetical protein
VRGAISDGCPYRVIYPSAVFKLRYITRANQGELGVWAPDYEWTNAQCFSSWESIFLKIKIIAMFGNSVIFIAAALRILPELSVFCRAKWLILLIRSALERTLDLLIGVRVPASQPLI